ncbi:MULTISPECIES: hypothetical protein [unclassified Paraburkholderia]|uniref:hypothetical protein n=1 Tax=unclassified Paraburkholderia TaxID=2615204 RepID=UPI0020B6F1A7|nr:MULTISPECIES: hypothetical protein [unclassified Paraburkholderia]MCP3718299.1 hypothetical protein [Paraburkholderia sp. CNPSo 3281]MCX5544354.1 hypothetical protein [Paraburkholderia sp. CNPSo 3076]
MHRVFSHRGFEIHVRLTEVSPGLYDAVFQIKGGDNVEVIDELGAETKLRRGPFGREKAFLNAQEAGQAAIDAVIGEDES